jgi:hypothetical protein
MEAHNKTVVLDALEEGREPLLARMKAREPARVA